MLYKNIEKFLSDELYMQSINSLCKSLTENKEVIQKLDNAGYTQGTYQNLSIKAQESLSKIVRKIHNWARKEFYKDKEIKLIDCKILKHYKHEKHEKLYQFGWHIDNHPESIINFIIYLNDVKYLEGGMELLFSKEDHMPVHRKFAGKPGGIHMDDEIRKLINEEKYYSVPLLGKQGTTILFNNNVIHRAGSSLTKDRAAILLQFDHKDSDFGNCHTSLIKNY